MYSKIAVVLVALTAAVAGHADVGQSVTLSDGTAATVIYEKGAMIAYVSGVKTDGDGKQVVERGQAFAGERIVQSAANTCYKTQDKLVELKDVAVGGAKVQLPTVQHTVTQVPCSQS